MDCPGVILDDQVEESEAALRNAIKIDQLQDPVGVIEALLKKVKKEQLMEIFHIPNFNNAVEFLSYVAQKRGKLKHVSFFKRIRMCFVKCLWKSRINRLYEGWWCWNDRRC